MSKNLTKVERRRWRMYQRLGQKRGDISRIARAEGITRQGIHYCLKAVKRKLTKKKDKTNATNTLESKQVRPR